MSRHNPEIAFRQILSHAKEINAIHRGKKRKDLDNDRLLNLALVRLIEIVGEAANRIPVEYQNKYPEIPWMQIISARNRLIHGYDSIDFDILWNIIKKDMPILEEKIEKVMSEEGWEITS